MMKLKKMTLAAAITAASLMTAIPAAYASNVLSVDGAASPASDVTAIGFSPASIAFMTDYAVPFTCTDGAVSGYLKRGATVAAGNKIGAITAASFNACVATSGMYSVRVVKKGATEWGIYATATPAKGQTSVAVEIRNTSLAVFSTGSPPWVCEFDMTGTLPATLNQSTQRLTVSSPSYPMAITAFNGAGTKTPSSVGTCGGQIYTGDRAKMSAVYTLTTVGLLGFSF